MAYTRKQIGSVLATKEEKLKYNALDKDGNIQKDKDGNTVKLKEYYIKITEDVTFKKGDFINLENKKVKLASLDAYKGSMSSESYEKALERIQNMPDFVQFELVKVSRD
jgi:LmbE family N-acetylglucosaminyl deacetylase